MIWLVPASIGVAYLIGSIPFGLLVGWARGVDIRGVGSGNIGATNAGRVLGLRYFWYVFLLDLIKGFLPVLASDLWTRQWFAPLWIPLATGAAAIAGHLFPIYLKFRGGKGIATSFGALLGVWPIFTLAALGAAMMFALVVMAYRIISAASLAGAVTFAALVPLVGHWLGPVDGWLYPLPWNRLMPLLWTSWLLLAVIIWKHRGNIRRLLKGTEPRWGQTAAGSVQPLPPHKNVPAPPG